MNSDGRYQGSGPICGSLPSCGSQEPGEPIDLARRAPRQTSDSIVACGFHCGQQCSPREDAIRAVRLGAGRIAALFPYCGSSRKAMWLRPASARRSERLGGFSASTPRCPFALRDKAVTRWVPARGVQLVLAPGPRNGSCPLSANVVQRFGQVAIYAWARNAPDLASIRQGRRPRRAGGLAFKPHSTRYGACGLWKWTCRRGNRESLPGRSEPASLALAGKEAHACSF